MCWWRVSSGNIHFYKAPMETVEMEGLHDSDYISFPTYGRRQQSESRIFHVTFSKLNAGTSRIKMCEILLYFQSCIGQYLVQVKPGLNVASEAYKRLEFVPPEFSRAGSIPWKSKVVLPVVFPLVLLICCFQSYGKSRDRVWCKCEGMTDEQAHTGGRVSEESCTISEGDESHSSTPGRSLIPVLRMIGSVKLSALDCLIFQYKESAFKYTVILLLYLLSY